MNPPSHRIAAWALGALLLASSPSLLGCGAPAKVAELVVHGDNRLLRHRAEGTPPSSPGHPAILFLAFDGVDRALLYDMLHKGELPMLSELLAGDHGSFPHTFFDDSFLSTLPSSTRAAWSTTMTGVGPAHHGVSGNEFFIR